jgi:hypothetical protein
MPPMRLIREGRLRGRRPRSLVETLLLCREGARLLELGAELHRRRDIGRIVEVEGAQARRSGRRGGLLAGEV